MKPSIADFILASIKNQDPELYEEIKEALQKKIEEKNKITNDNGKLCDNI